MNKQKMTLESFDYQWENLSEAPYLLSDENWRENVSDYILDELELTEEEIGGKRVLDAGCGNGRWAYGFVKLGCETYGFDPSEHGVKYAIDHVQDGYFNVANVLDHQSLLELYPENSFDLVWCWGVLHHTGDAELGFRNLTKFVKPSGMIHLYLYGSKSRWNPTFRFIFNLFPFKIRILLSIFLSKINKSSIHGNFDAFSPPIASNHTEAEVKQWFEESGFTFKRVQPKWAFHSKDLFVTGFKVQTPTPNTKHENTQPICPFTTYAHICIPHKNVIACQKCPNSIPSVTPYENLEVET